MSFISLSKTPMIYSLYSTPYQHLGKRSVDKTSNDLMSMSSEDHLEVSISARRLMGIAIVWHTMVCEARAHYPVVQHPSSPPNAKIKCSRHDEYEQKKYADETPAHLFPK